MVTGQAAYEAFRAAVPDWVCNVPAGPWDELSPAVRQGFDAIAAQEPEPAPASPCTWWSDPSDDFYGMCVKDAYHDREGDPEHENKHGIRWTGQRWEGAATRPAPGLPAAMARAGIHKAVDARRALDAARAAASEVMRLVPLGRHASPDECDQIRQALRAIVTGAVQ